VRFPQLVARCSLVKICIGRREGRLQGLHLTTSLVRPPPVSRVWTFHFSHGLCSPSRLASPPPHRRLPVPGPSLRRFTARPPSAPREWLLVRRSQPEGHDGRAGSESVRGGGLRVLASPTEAGAAVSAASMGFVTSKNDPSAPVLSWLFVALGKAEASSSPPKGHESGPQREPQSTPTAPTSD
jgi:hypothetical protein